LSKTATPSYVYIRFDDCLVNVTGSYNKITKIGSIVIENQPISKEVKQYTKDQLEKVKL